MKNFKNLIVLTMWLLSTFATMAQTIDYSYESLSTSSCNVFASATTVDNYTHLTTLSRPRYSDNSIRLDCKPNNTETVLATIYSINYNFKAGYNYVITVYYKGVKDASDGFYPHLGLKLSATNGGTDNGTNCVDPSSYTKTNASTFTQGASGSSYAWTNNSFFNVTPSQNQDYLLVGAFPYPTGTSYLGSIYIRTIQIVETAPFTLPSTTNITCGSTSGVTFTATNVFNNPNVTNYTWNIGSTPNGWNYNGSPASSTISTGTTNSITLTPVACSTLTNISVTVTAGGNTYTTNTSTITTVLPTLTIGGGPNTICSSENYSVSNLPCGASVSWSASPSNLVTLTPSGNQVSVQKVGNGQITLTASITNACGTGTSVNKDIHVGYLPAAAEMFFNAVEYDNYAEDLCVDAGQYYDVAITEMTFASSYSWEIDAPSGVVTVNSGQGTNLINVLISGPLNTSLRFSVRAVNSCGYGSTTQVDGEICGEIIPPRINASPNPTTGDIMIELIDKKQTIKEIQITDKYGNLKKRIKVGIGTKKQKINIGELRAGIYIIRVYDGTTWTTKKVIKK